MQTRWIPSVENPTVYLAMLLLLAGGYYGSSRSFGNFLFSIPILALLFLGATIAVVRAEVRKARRAATIGLRADLPNAFGLSIFL